MFWKMVYRFDAFLLFCLILTVTSFSNSHYGRFEQYSFELGAVQIQVEENEETIEQRN